jgi:hypothetical protein
MTVREDIFLAWGLLSGGRDANCCDTSLAVAAIAAQRKWAAAKLLSKDEAGRIAANFAKLPDC